MSDWMFPTTGIGNCDRCPMFDCIPATHLLIRDGRPLAGLCDRHAEEVRSNFRYRVSVACAEADSDNDEVAKISAAMAKAETLSLAEDE